MIKFEPFGLNPGGRWKPRGFKKCTHCPSPFLFFTHSVRNGSNRTIGFGFKTGGGLGRPELTNPRFNPSRGRFSHRWFTIDQIQPPPFRFEPRGKGRWNPRECKKCTHCSSPGSFSTLSVRNGSNRTFGFALKTGGGLGRSELTNPRFKPPRGRFSHRWFTIDQIRTFRFKTGRRWNPRGCKKLSLIHI